MTYLEARVAAVRDHLGAQRKGWAKPIMFLRVLDDGTHAEGVLIPALDGKKYDLTPEDIDEKTTDWTVVKAV